MKSTQYVTMASPSITNVITAVDLGCAIDLHYLTMFLLEKEYTTPQHFHQVTLRLDDPKSCANVFSSGKLICLGNRSVAAAEIATKRFVGMIKDVGFPCQMLNYRITNISGSGDLKFMPDMFALYEENKKNTTFVPELFPGIHYRDADGITITLFHTGKLTITNAKHPNQLQTAYEAFRKKVRPKTISVGAVVE